VWKASLAAVGGDGNWAKRAASHLSNSSSEAKP